MVKGSRKMIFGTSKGRRFREFHEKNRRKLLHFPKIPMEYPKMKGNSSIGPLREGGCANLVQFCTLTPDIYGSIPPQLLLFSTHSFLRYFYQIRVLKRDFRSKTTDFWVVFGNFTKNWDFFDFFDVPEPKVHGNFGLRDIPTFGILWKLQFMELDS